MPRTQHVQHEADKAMVRSERQQHFVDQQDMLEVVDDGFAVQKIHGDAQEIPVEGPCEWQTFLLGWDLGDTDDFLEGNNLNCRDQEQHIDVPAEHAKKETTDHDKGPDRSNDKCLLLFLIVGLDPNLGLQYRVAIDSRPVHVYWAARF